MTTTHEEAASKQYLHHSYYTVWLVNPDGERLEKVGELQRKSGSAVLALLQRSERIRERLNAIPGMQQTTFKKTKEGMFFSNGYKVIFGGTIRQEAAAAEQSRRDARLAGERAIVASGKCPACGRPLRRNLALSGWWQCSQYGAEGFRADASQPSCNWQTFTQ